MCARNLNAKAVSAIVGPHLHIHVLMRDERRKKERSKQGQTNNKAKQHSTPKGVTFPKKNELPQVCTDI